jgi:hypothetical protein
MLGMPKASMRLPTIQAPLPHAKLPNMRCWPKPSLVPSVSLKDAMAVSVVAGAVAMRITLT